MFLGAQSRELVSDVVVACGLAVGVAHDAASCAVVFVGFVEGEESGFALLDGYELTARVDRGFGLLVAGAGVGAARDVSALAGADGLAGGVVDEGAQECAAGVAGADLEELVQEAWRGGPAA